MALMSPKFLTDDVLMEMIQQHKGKPYGDICEAELANRMTVKPKPDDEFPNISEIDARIIRERMNSGIHVLGECGKYGLRELKTEKRITSVEQSDNMISCTITITFKGSVSASGCHGDTVYEDNHVEYRAIRSWNGECTFEPIVNGTPVKFTR